MGYSEAKCPPKLIFRYLASSFLGSKGPPNNKIHSKVSRVYAGVRVAKDFEELVRRDVSKDDVAVPSN